MEMDDIKVEQVGLDGIGSTTRLSGTLTSNQELTHMISSRVPGRIQKLKVRATGRYISKGAPLYEIYSEELLALQNEYLMMLEQNRNWVVEMRNMLALWRRRLDERSVGKECVSECRCRWSQAH